MHQLPQVSLRYVFVSKRNQQSFRLATIGKTKGLRSLAAGLGQGVICAAELQLPIIKTWLRGMHLTAETLAAHWRLLVCKSSF